jgi:hypothetical protein
MEVAWTKSEGTDLVRELIPDFRGGIRAHRIREERDGAGFVGNRSNGRCDVAFGRHSTELRPRRRAPRGEAPSGAAESEPAADRLIRATAYAVSDEASKSLLVCPLVLLFGPEYANRRVRVQFDRALTPRERFEKALTMQGAASGTHVHMAGQDAIVVVPRAVTTADLRDFRKTAGVFAARSHARPVDPVPHTLWTTP